MPSSSPSDREMLLAALSTTDEEKAATELVAEMLRRQYNALNDELSNVMKNTDLSPKIQLSLGLSTASALASMYESALRIQAHADLVEMVSKLDLVSKPLVDAMSNMPPGLRDLLLNMTLDD